MRITAKTACMVILAGSALLLLSVVSLGSSDPVMATPEELAALKGMGGEECIGYGCCCHRGGGSSCQWVDPTVTCVANQVPLPNTGCTPETYEKECSVYSPGQPETDDLCIESGREGEEEQCSYDEGNITCVVWQIGHCSELLPGCTCISHSPVNIPGRKLCHDSVECDVEW